MRFHANEFGVATTQKQEISFGWSAMPPRSRYAVDPSLTAQAANQQQQWQNPPQQPGQADQYGGQGYINPNPQLHQVSDRATPPPTGIYAPTQPQYPQQLQHQNSYQNDQPQQFQQPIHSSFIPPQNHIPPPPHSAGPSMQGPRVRIDPSQVPNPVEAQEMDQNLYDEDDFLSCQPRGVMPLAGTDYRGVDQGNHNPIN